ncbi:N-acetylglucosamine-specific PTS transporter subunit IIBC [Latilactobacillus fuchuensis]|nr:N-acetylglucosamine-specific PTS transporter subunit IIBC [Latilactobacillus fuchuensis]SPC39647.1 PTS system N-acetylglucosamine-specific EIICBA component (Includes: N-acetylglucosamine permease IIC component; N-acetylglucosamine-specific phosphotransferase enzyme IIB component; N-acetylglucosamine-specific phosphotransferase enzyme IIA component) [Latilactobacillus fuchuensis]
MKNYLQRMGRSLMLPVAVLPAAAILMGIANWVGNGDSNANIFTIFLAGGSGAILNNLPLLFAVGLALGMSKDQDGAAALAGLVAFLVPKTILAPASVQAMQGLSDIAKVNPAFGKIEGNVLIGILAGLIAAAMYNKFHNVKLPMALSFFSGKRLVPIMAAAAMVVVSAILYFVWPAVFTVLVAFGKAISNLGWAGAGIYGFFNRLLIPTGLHHALNSVFWFDVANINDIGNFLGGAKSIANGTAIVGKTGMYQAGFFPVMMFGLPAGAYAIYKNARPERKKATASLMLAAGFASFFTGVTEPLEFSFMFVAWPLYVLHAAFTGISLAIAAFFHWTAGFAFSAGLVDYVLSLKNPVANQPLMLLVEGLAMAAIYYFGFNFAIKKFNLMTPGREVEEVVDDAPSVATDENDDKFMIQAKKIYAAIGGKANIKVIDNCTTRLRLQLEDTGKANQAAIKAAGVAGINVLDQTNIQIIIGTEVQFVADALKELFNSNAPIGTVTGDAPVAEAAVVNSDINAGMTDEFYTVADGQLIDIEAVDDATFAQKMLGDGYAVIPTDGKIVSPVSGTIMTVFPTKHAIGIKTEDGLEVLVHMGIDTVELKGAPFEVAVEEGQTVQHGDLLANVDLAQIVQAGKQTAMMVIITNMADVAYFKSTATGRTVQSNEIALKATTK